VSLSDEIFPANRHPDFVQTEWSRGWVYQSIGFGEAARFLTEHSSSFQGSIDSVGLAVFFLQRHRVELVLKELLIAHGGNLNEVQPAHSLGALWKACEGVIGADVEGWRHIESEGGPIVMLLHERDPSPHTYRYPVDRRGNEHRRADQIDLAALELHVSRLVSAIDGCKAYSEQVREYEEEMQRDFEEDMRERYGEDEYGR
jgi:hypothetical protein